MYSLIIKNANVIDGSGKSGQILDVAVEGDRIVNISEKISGNAISTIDASGKVLTPGFIDIQNHSDSYWQIFDNPSLDSMVTQGFTSILIGNCGASLAPLLSKNALLSIQKWHNLEGANINWQSFGEYLEQLGKMQFGCNIASLVGYSTLRRGVVGDEIRSLQKDELEVLKKALRESLNAGAFGFSSGLSYAHEIIISELELFELAKIVKEYEGLFSIHLRSEGAEVVEAVSEALDIAKAGNLNLKISHLKIRNEQNWNKLADVIAEIDTAFHQGLNVHFDAYPYESIWQVLYSYLPKWAIEGGRAVMLRHFSDPIQKNKILSYLNNSGVKFSNLMIASTTNKLNFTGKTIGQVAKNLEMSSEQALLHILENGGSEILVFEENLDIASVEKLLFHPLSFIATDGAGFPEKNQSRLVHPRCFGTSAKFLQTVIEKKAISLESAINKLTLGPANKIGLKSRGKIAVGNFADLVIFTPSELSSKSTYLNPNQFSTGFDYVFVNGQAVVNNKIFTSRKPGYVLKKS